MKSPDKEKLLKEGQSKYYNTNNSEQIDLVTGLLNKSAIEQIISEKMIDGGTFFLVDCADMKIIKQEHGEDFGNKLFYKFAKRLKRVCRDSDYIGRIDEYKFLIFMPLILKKHQINHIIERLKYTIQEEMLHNHLEKLIVKGVRISVITSKEEDVRSLEDVLLCLSNILKHSLEEKEQKAADSDSTEIFSRVFSMQVQNMMSADELTKTMQAMNNTNRANFFIRLKDQSYVVLKDVLFDQKKDAFLHKNAKKMLGVNVENKVSPEFKDNLVAFTDLDTLADRMKDEDSIRYEYKNIHNVWCVATFSAIEREDGKVTKVIYLVSDLTHDRAEAQELLQMQKEAISLLSNSELLYISVINSETGACRLIQSKRLLSSDRTFDFDNSMKRESRHLLPSEQKEFLKKARLDYIKEELIKNNHYTITSFLQLPDSGRYRRFLYHFSICKEFPGYILSATEDITEPFIRDDITGMKNFEGFKMDYLYETNRFSPDQYIIINFNIANFKAINTLYGYNAGNRLLKKVFHNIKNNSLPFLSICRENADNYFCLLRKEDYDFDQLNNLCKMLIVDDDGLSETLELFCGIYIISNNNDTFDIVCDKARIAKRHAEQEIGVNAYVLKEEEKARYLDEASILSSISGAIHNGEMAVYYQPIYDAQNGKLASAEALVRWIHPEKGMISPGLFIPVAERTGHIADIDLYVGQHVRDFQSKRFGLGKVLVPISINVSRYDFVQDSYMKIILEEMKNYSEIANMIRIEITESGLINIPSSGEYFMHEMRSLGIKTMIDDFGTGYSSLTSIVDRPCDIIKLDMSFARKIGIEKKMEILVIVSIETAHRLGVKVVAEGVETKEQYEFLKENGCDFIQGFYFSKPISEKEFEELLDS